jgi:hypothetical protein
MEPIRPIDRFPAWPVHAAKSGLVEAKRPIEAAKPWVLSLVFEMPTIQR